MKPDAKVGKILKICKLQELFDLYKSLVLS
jgi:hypothetical protein